VKTVAVLTSWYPNDIRVFKEVKSIKKKYHVLIFLTDTSKTCPRVKQFDNVSVYRFPYSYYKNKFIRYFSSFLRYLKIAKNVMASTPQICHVHNFPFLFSGILVKLFTKSKLIYDAHEDYASLRYPDNSLFIYLCRMVELWLVKLFVDRVITVNESLRSYFSESGVKTYTIMNLPIVDVHPSDSEKEPLTLFTHDFTIGYIGHIIADRGYETLIPICRHLIGSTENSIKFLIVGGGPFKKKFEEIIKKSKLQDYFIMTGEVDYTQIPTFLKRIDAGLILFKPTCYNNIIATPNKLFEYMSVGKPIIASNLPEIKKIVEEVGCGVLVDPTNPEEIADKIMYLLNNPKKAEKMGKKGQKAFEDKYNWKVESEKLLEIYKNITRM
jgi:glycosyltransferase involved in cell wall biosynthesis